MPMLASLPAAASSDTPLITFPGRISPIRDAVKLPDLVVPGDRIQTNLAGSDEYVAIIPFFSNADKELGHAVLLFINRAAFARSLSASG